MLGFYPVELKKTWVHQALSPEGGREAKVMTYEDVTQVHSSMLNNSSG